MPSGVVSSARSAIVQQVLRGSGASKPRTNLPTRVQEFGTGKPSSYALHQPLEVVVSTRRVYAVNAATA